MGDSLILHELSAPLVAFNDLMRRPKTESEPERAFFYVDFEGKLPPGMSFSNLPLEVVIKLPAQYAAYLSPMLTIVTAEGKCMPVGRLRVTFLPLPLTFNYRQQSCWEALESLIQDWILTVPVNTSSPERTWAIDAFWIAYVASYPCFPREPWCRWDPSIPLLGTWGERWFTRSHRPGVDDAHNENCEGDCAACLVIREELWVEFQNFARLFNRDGPILGTE